MASLGRDLAFIRKERGVSFDELKDITKLPPAILESIEDDSIFDDIDSNTTYIRSYVRNYAKAVEIDEDKIIHALDRVETGEYTGSIGQLAAGKREKSDQPDRMIHDHSPEYSVDEPAAGSDKDEETTPESNKASVDWAALGNKASGSGSSVNTGRWSAILLIVFIVVIGILFYSYFNNGEDKNTTDSVQVTQSQPTMPADTLQASLLPQNEDSETFGVPPLPDTLRIAVIAANGKLEPVHIISDIGPKRPFWIERHDTMHFSFSDTLYVWAVNGFDRMKLMFNGKVLKRAYPQFYNPETERIMLTRQIFKNHPEWRRDFSDVNF